jgi:hypothetical protein
MNLIQIFANPQHLDLALTLAALPGDAPDREQLLHRAGLQDGQRKAFLKTLQVFEKMRLDAGCATCEDTNACLDANTLSEFVDGVLSEEAKPFVERQLAHCGACLGKAVALAQLTHELTPAPRWPEVVLGLARRGVHFITAPLTGFAEQTLQPVPVMAGEAPEVVVRQWTLQDRDIVGVFTLTQEEDGLAGLSVRFERDGAPVTRGRIELRLDDTLLESHPISSGEERAFWHLESGQYRVDVLLSADEGATFGIVLEQTAGA